jgi:predicted nucleotide-binding protein (sugar kinase/HSP70/actin superfamily)
MRTFEKAMSSISIIEQARKNSKYNTRKSDLNKKWTRYLKNRKLFDEYMVYLAGHDAIGVEPKTYKQISNICYNMNGKVFGVHSSDRSITVDWIKEFRQFFKETVKWYEFKHKLWFAANFEK